jgi:hypothetical protein
VRVCESDRQPKKPKTKAKADTAKTAMWELAETGLDSGARTAILRHVRRGVLFTDRSGDHPDKEPPLSYE